MAGNTINDNYGGTPSMLQPSPDSVTFEQDADALFLGYLSMRYHIEPTDSKTLDSILALYALKDFENDNIWRVSQCGQDLGVAWYVDEDAKARIATHWIQLGYVRCPSCFDEECSGIQIPLCCAARLACSG